jgi:hypothetical protein
MSFNAFNLQTAVYKLSQIMTECELTISVHKQNWWYLKDEIQLEEGVQAAMTPRNLEPEQWRNREEWHLVSRRWRQLL